MEEALILIVLASSFRYESIEELRKIPGVTEVHPIYGQYDHYVKVKGKEMGEIRQIVLNIRNSPGIKSTVTCNVIQQT